MRRDNPSETRHKFSVANTRHDGHSADVVIWTLLLLSAFCPPVSAGSLDAALEKAALLMKSGQPAEALQHCLETRVEHPQSAELLFVMGYAQAALGDQRIKDRKPAEAAAQYHAARESFERCVTGGGYRLGAAATFNAATCLLRLDAAFDPKAEYDRRVDNLQAAVAELTALVASRPEHERGRKNLEHARYRLALLLQAPPREEEQPKDEEKKDEPEPISEVVGATTQIPNATAEVVDGSTVVLRIQPGEGGQP